MKKLAFLTLVLVSSWHLLAQQTAAAPQAPQQAPYLRFPDIPPFHILKVDSVGYFNKEDIKKHHRTIIMCFSPECEHCKHQTEDLLAAMDKLKDIEIVMATFQPFGEMKTFYTHYHISNYNNILMGRDEKYFFQPFYNYHSFPFLALYDKKGKLVTTFEGNQKIDKILDAFNKSTD